MSDTSNGVLSPVPISIFDSLIDGEEVQREAIAISRQKILDELEAVRAEIDALPSIDQLKTIYRSYRLTISPGPMQLRLMVTDNGWWYETGLQGLLALCSAHGQLHGIDPVQGSRGGRLTATVRRSFGSSYNSGERLGSFTASGESADEAIVNALFRAFPIELARVRYVPHIEDSVASTSIPDPATITGPDISPEAPDSAVPVETRPDAHRANEAGSPVRGTAKSGWGDRSS